MRRATTCPDAMAMSVPAPALRVMAARRSPMGLLPLLLCVLIERGSNCGPSDQGSDRRLDRASVQARFESARSSSNLGRRGAVDIGDGHGQNLVELTIAHAAPELVQQRAGETGDHAVIGPE